MGEVQVTPPDPAREDVPYLLAQLAAARERAERAEGALVEVYPLLHEACQGSMCCLNGFLADKVRAIIGNEAADGL